MIGIVRRDRPRRVWGRRSVSESVSAGWREVCESEGVEPDNQHTQTDDPAKTGEVLRCGPCPRRRGTLGRNHDGRRDYTPEGA
jgi:hypothetical protein